MKNYWLAFIFFAFVSTQTKAQVLISLIFGDKLNSEHVEFGLDGAFNFANQRGESSSYTRFFNLGFYFDFDINKSSKWLLGTGVMVKSNMGAENLPFYSTGDAELDVLFKDGTVNRKISYFNVPILIKRNLFKGLYLGAGPMLGLRSKAYDTYTANPTGNGQINYRKNIKDDIKSLDAGILTSLQYKLGQTGGMSIFIKYYYGLVDINDSEFDSNIYNQSFYVGVTIPVNGIKSKSEK